ncbi:hypothetical protein VMCG_00388 [Cytospora schulzeri]|uniref:Aminoglycoside phosphotransferase domain-containing protein n=1 Tax=Cytospora schulzeri TaxID=448051 RepID=A0A423X900_9PEZI|nr:hypothetical protein VMCG_00388 [Valsa malicola]
MAEPTAAEIASRITQELASTKFACSTLVPLSGGTANFIFKGILVNPFENGTVDVVMKHGEGFVAQHPVLKLSTLRCDCLKALEKLPRATNQLSSVRTPRLFHVNSDSTTQAQEYLPNSLDLKTYALRYFSCLTPESEKSSVLEIGRVLGKWLRSFHDWAASPKQEVLRSRVKLNKEMQGIKLTYNYEKLMWLFEKFPFLKESKSVFEDIIAKVKAELVDESQLQIIHGDFWTGNVLLPDAELKPDRLTSLFVIDWEMCQLGMRPLDLGQMIAELYELTLYKDIKAGLWIIDGFLAGYGSVDDDFAYRTALHVGTHLVGFGTSVPGWGTSDQVEMVAKTGMDIILRAWETDRGWFEAHDLAPLFRRDT